MADLEHRWLRARIEQIKRTAAAGAAPSRVRETAADLTKRRASGGLKTARELPFEHEASPNDVAGGIGPSFSDAPVPFDRDGRPRRGSVANPLLPGADEGAPPSVVPLSETVHGDSTVSSGVPAHRESLPR